MNNAELSGEKNQPAEQKKDPNPKTFKLPTFHSNVILLTKYLQQNHMNMRRMGFHHTSQFHFTVSITRF